MPKRRLKQSLKMTARTFVNPLPVITGMLLLASHPVSATDSGVSIRR
ncbi:MAG: hypothetical protein L0Z73_12550 [Gammaproteobacteria bacterium]|nr:hypothetical protein [Gammaproteobacteria bacterium]